MKFNNFVQKIDWDKVNDLIPAIIQNSRTGRVLMLGYMNREALQLTIEKKEVVFYSRTKERLWRKGEESGNVLNLKDISLDCDADTLLIAVDPVGPTCHLGRESCFENESIFDSSFLLELENIICQRKTDSSENSYTKSLFAKRTKRIAQKVGEEGVEVALAAMARDPDEIINESADLLYHLLVLLQDQEIELNAVISILKKRQNK